MAGQVVADPARRRAERRLVAERGAAGLDERHERGVGGHGLLVELGGDPVTVLVGPLHDGGEQLAPLLRRPLDLGVEPPGLVDRGQVAQRPHGEQEGQHRHRERHGPRRVVADDGRGAEQGGQADQRGDGRQAAATHLGVGREAAEAEAQPAGQEQRHEQDHAGAERLEGDDRRPVEREAADAHRHLHRAVDGADGGEHHAELLGRAGGLAQPQVEDDRPVAARHHGHGADRGGDREPAVGVVDDALAVEQQERGADRDDGDHALGHVDRQGPPARPAAGQADDRHGEQPADEQHGGHARPGRGVQAGDRAEVHAEADDVEADDRRQPQLPRPAVGLGGPLLGQPGHREGGGGVDGAAEQHEDEDVALGVVHEQPAEGRDRNRGRDVADAELADGGAEHALERPARAALGLGGGGARPVGVRQARHGLASRRIGDGHHLPPLSHRPTAH